MHSSNRGVLGGVSHARSNLRESIITVKGEAESEAVINGLKKARASIGIKFKYMKSLMGI